MFQNSVVSASCMCAMTGSYESIVREHVLCMVHRRTCSRMMLCGHICDQLPAARQTRTHTHTNTHTHTHTHAHTHTQRWRPFGVRATKARAGTRVTEDVYYSVCMCMCVSVCVYSCLSVRVCVMQTRKMCILHIFCDSCTCMSRCKW